MSRLPLYVTAMLILISREKEMRRNVVACMFFITVFTLMVASCNGNSQRDLSRKWMAERTESYVNLYKVAYGKVAEIQGKDHPCTRGHNADEAALFHAVLQNLNTSFKTYNNDVSSKLGRMLTEDDPTRELLSTVKELSKPFADLQTLGQCGKLDAATAKERFYLQAPGEALQLVCRYRERLDDDS